MVVILGVFMHSISVIGLFLSVSVIVSGMLMTSTVRKSAYHRAPTAAERVPRTEASRGVASDDFAML